VLDLEVAETETSVDQAGGCDEPTDAQAHTPDVLTAAEQLLRTRQFGKQGSGRTALAGGTALLQRAGELPAALALDAVGVHRDPVVRGRRGEARRREGDAAQRRTRRKLATLPRTCPAGDGA
jgi:hypothetical protein